jgi:hypothetical protein
VIASGLRKWPSCRVGLRSSTPDIDATVHGDRHDLNAFGAEVARATVRVRTLRTSPVEGDGLRARLNTYGRTRKEHGAPTRNHAAGDFFGRHECANALTRQSASNCSGVIFLMVPPGPAAGVVEQYRSSPRAWRMETNAAFSLLLSPTSQAEPITLPPAWQISLQVFSDIQSVQGRTAGEAARECRAEPGTDSGHDCDRLVLRVVSLCHGGISLLHPASFKRNDRRAVT